MQNAKCGTQNKKSKSICKFAFLIFSFLLLTGVGSLLTVRAQTDEPPKDAAPPPVRVMSKEERKEIETETSAKKRTELALNLMEIRLRKAEDAANQNQFQITLEELGGYQALLDNALNYLERHDDRSNKIDYNFKRLEIGLRRVVPRLEILRRAMPFNYGYYVVKLQKFVRETRARAMEPLFDDTVVPERKPK